MTADGRKSDGPLTAAEIRQYLPSDPLSLRLESRSRRAIFRVKDHFRRGLGTVMVRSSLWKRRTDQWSRDASSGNSPVAESNPIRHKASRKD